MSLHIAVQWQCECLLCQGKRKQTRTWKVLLLQETGPQAIRMPKKKEGQREQ
jgi:hypothetical protein